MLILWTTNLAAESPIPQRESSPRRSKGDTYTATIRAPKADQLTSVVAHLVRGVRSRFDSWVTTLEAKSRPAPLFDNTRYDARCFNPPAKDHCYRCEVLEVSENLRYADHT
jgi:hypothetical protein